MQQCQHGTGESRWGTMGKQGWGRLVFLKHGDRTAHQPDRQASPAQTIAPRWIAKT